MTTVPGPFYTPAQRFPALSLCLSVALVCLAVASAFGWPAAGLTLPAIASVVLLLPVLAPLEVLLGTLLMTAAAACCCAIALLVPLLLDGSRQLNAATLLMVAYGLQGIGFGVMQGSSTRPLCALGGPTGQLALPWWVGAALGGVGLVMIFWGMDLSAAIYALLAFATGTILGVAVNMTGLASEPAAAGAISGGRLNDSLARIQALLDDHKVAEAQRAIEAVCKVAPQDARVRQLRYAVWKFEPQKPQFHLAACTLLLREQAEGGSPEITTALYKDYLAVAQGQPQLDPNQHLTLAHRFADWDVTDHAANIVNVYLQRDPRNRTLPRTMLALAQAYVRGQNNNRATYFAETLLTLMPTTSEAHLAQRLLRQVKVKTS